MIRIIRNDSFPPVDTHLNDMIHFHSMIPIQQIDSFTSMALTKIMIHYISMTHIKHIDSFFVP